MVFDPIRQEWLQLMTMPSLANTHVVQSGLATMGNTKPAIITDQLNYGHHAPPQMLQPAWQPPVITNPTTQTQQQMTTSQPDQLTGISNTPVSGIDPNDLAKVWPLLFHKRAPQVDSINPLLANIETMVDMSGLIPTFSYPVHKWASTTKSILLIKAKSMNIDLNSEKARGMFLTGILQKLPPKIVERVLSIKDVTVVSPLDLLKTYDK